MVNEDSIKIDPEEEEKIRKFMNLSTEDKLRWLEEINQFLKLVLTEEDWKIREQIRSENHY